LNLNWLVIQFTPIKIETSLEVPKKSFEKSKKYSKRLLQQPRIDASIQPKGHRY
jgi:hypothetical protein